MDGSTGVIWYVAFFKDNVGYWRSDKLGYWRNRSLIRNSDTAADQAIEAKLLANLPTFPIATVFRGKRLLGADRTGVPWSPQIF
jgi:hypothetical protein